MPTPTSCGKAAEHTKPNCFDSTKTTIDFWTLVTETFVSWTTSVLFHLLFNHRARLESHTQTENVAVGISQAQESLDVGTFRWEKALSPRRRGMTIGAGGIRAIRGLFPFSPLTLEEVTNCAIVSRLLRTLENVHLCNDAPVLGLFARWCAMFSTNSWTHWKYTVVGEGSETQVNDF